MTRRFAAEVLGPSVDKRIEARASERDRRRAQPHDAPMFGFFPNARGVVNEMLAFRGRFDQRPKRWPMSPMPRAATALSKSAERILPVASEPHTNRDIVHDLVIIGGGVNGCGIARDAAGRGMSVLVRQKADLGSAASSASTKLIHGGLRYLEHYDFAWSASR